MEFQINLPTIVCLYHPDVDENRKFISSEKINENGKVIFKGVVEQEYDICAYHNSFDNVFYHKYHPSNG